MPSETTIGPTFFVTQEPPNLFDDEDMCVTLVVTNSLACFQRHQPSRLGASRRSKLFRRTLTECVPAFRRFGGPECLLQYRPDEINRKIYRNNKIGGQVYSRLQDIGVAVGGASGVHYGLDALETLCWAKPTHAWTWFLLYYPALKTRNKKNVEAMRKSEAELDGFWKAADVGFEEHLGSAHREYEVPILAWVDRPTVGAHSPRPKHAFFEDGPFSHVFHDPAKDITGAFDRLDLVRWAHYELPHLTRISGIQ
ncbi:hypothetical protein K504DRAFT_453508 [Pleomassaria siparia CBS 279.74]|uniref:Uncharacterized protein n=1 Tax=Pleomassaria siparia CBS 279.74 TaxID=1314801 RepID=A0A6G1KH70_9PLEO|nr:hypothetical protein K504DRAFT_453508 [Pleomassaria siparia CBS 279.74]